MALPEQDIELLEDLLFSDILEEDALDYFGVHGLVCASIVGPKLLSDEAIFSLVFGVDDPVFSDNEVSFFNSCIKTIACSIKECLLEGNEILMPYSGEINNDESNHYDACLQSWCTGFIEGFFHCETSWFSKGEDIAAELLLPIMALSDLFDSDEFQEIKQNHKLMSQFEEIMPEQLVDIFLFFHSD